MNRNTQRGHADPNAPTLNTDDRSNASGEYQAPREESNQKDSDSRRDTSQQSSTEQSDQPATQGEQSADQNADRK